ncbi:ABC transporter substrate-binding protein [Prodigiosinella confusarubida]|uniref:ABC transporter substrate-binding protein n=1 Tax=Serratia sp. (strain ATCC 39006) TaxID=104623 RepID=A0A2I5T664_SERS3|nr:transporter substrate-binding domain-containing protein [Serratia sp. ATCC 39006]AUH00048.1 ABC transporter substrate-binding protein [Serratia sp. ATCC 39006]AUH04367.1 ABC transporter substrate-binding protein [Serratia sp. ATCC 39006]
MSKNNIFQRIISISVLSAAIAFACSAQAKEWKTVTIATEGSYEPWNLTLPGGKLGGFEPELMHVLCQRMSIKCKLVVQNWDGMIAGLQAGKFDVLMDAIVITPERRQVIDFSIPYASTPASFIVLKNKLLPPATGDNAVIRLTNDPAQITPAIAGLREALKGKTIGIASGTVYTPFIDQYFKDIATIREYTASADAILDLQAGRIDAVFDDVTFANSIMNKPENKDLTLSGPQLAGPIWGEGEALGIRKSDPELKAKFDAAIKSALADGTVKALSEKWFKTDVTP